jgi:hypothetical protein
MNRKIRNGYNVALVLGLLVLLGAPALRGAAVAQQKLKPEVNVALENVTIAAALDCISQQVGIRIELSDDAIWKLPEGKETRISARLEGSLAGSLDQMLNELFLRYTLSSEPLMIYPRPELRHILGRPTARSLRLLRNIYAHQALVSHGSDNPALAQTFLNQLAGEPITVFPAGQFEYVTAMLDKLARRGSLPTGVSGTALVTPVTLAYVLDETAADLNGFHEWYISLSDIPNQVPQIRIEKRTEFAQARLDQLVDVSFENESGEKIIGTLAHRADMSLLMGDAAAHAMTRRISLAAQNVTLGTALQKALAALGIQWEMYLDQSLIKLTGVKTAVSEPTIPSPPALPADTYVGKISIPMDGGRYFLEFMLRESDLTEELKKLRAEKIRAILQASSTADANEPAGRSN